MPPPPPHAAAAAAAASAYDDCDAGATPAASASVSAAAAPLFYLCRVLVRNVPLERWSGWSLAGVGALAVLESRPSKLDL